MRGSSHAPRHDSRRDQGGQYPPVARLGPERFGKPVTTPKHEVIRTGHPDTPYAYRGVLIEEWKRARSSHWQRFTVHATDYHPDFPKLFASTLAELLKRIDAELDKEP